MMETEGVPIHEELIGESMLYVVLMEHHLGRDYIRELTEALAKYRTGDRTASSQIVEDSENYIELLIQHIEKEDEILYPMADKYLSQEKRGELRDEFEIIDHEFDYVKQKEFYKLLWDLKRIYIDKFG